MKELAREKKAKAVTDKKEFSRNLSRCLANVIGYSDGCCMRVGDFSPWLYYCLPYQGPQETICPPRTKTLIDYQREEKIQANAERC